MTQSSPGGAGLYLVVEKFPGASTLEVTEGVEDALETLRPGLTGLSTDTSVFRPASYIASALDNLGVAFAVGARLMLLVLLALRFHWRAVLIALVTIPAVARLRRGAAAASRARLQRLALVGLAAGVAVVVDEAVAPDRPAGRAPLAPAQGRRRVGPAVERRPRGGWRDPPAADLRDPARACWRSFRRRDGRTARRLLRRRSCSPMCSPSDRRDARRGDGRPGAQRAGVQELAPGRPPAAAAPAARSRLLVGPPAVHRAGSGVCWSPSRVCARARRRGRSAARTLPDPDLRGQGPARAAGRRAGHVEPPDDRDHRPTSTRPAAAPSPESPTSALTSAGRSPVTASPT